MRFACVKIGTANFGAFACFIASYFVLQGFILIAPPQFDSQDGLLDRDLLELLPSAAEQTKEIIRDYAQPSKWSDTYKNMRRKYDDFDAYS